MLIEWSKLPKYMQNEYVLPYYKILYKKKKSLYIKRAFDIVVSFFLIIIFLPIFLVISICIILDSKGRVFYKQECITKYGKKFKVYKFRTMIENADKLGNEVTILADKRITRVGKVLRKYRLDELTQLLNVLKGEMTIVGTRPESTYYVGYYKNEMLVTLLLPAGITSETSIRYRNEASLLAQVEDVDKVYIENILPEKMKYNLESLKNFSFWSDIKTIFRTILAVLR